MTKNNCFGTKGGIELKPGPNFEFVHYLKVYKKNYQFGPWKDPGGPSKWKGPPKFSTFYSLTQMKKIIPLEPKVGLNSNQALNLSLSIV